MLFNNSPTMSVSVPYSPMAHISNNHSSLKLLTFMVVPCPCTFMVKKTPIPKLVLGCSGLPIEEQHIINLDDDGECDLSKAIVDSNDYLNDVNNGDVGLKERTRRMRIGLANKGRVPWNKGRKHSAETLERIRQRTAEALRDPKIKQKMAEHPRNHSDNIKAKISHAQKRVWHQRLKPKRQGELFFLLWLQTVATAAKKGGICQEELDWDSYGNIKEQLELHQIRQAEEKEKQKMMEVVGGKKLIQSWCEYIANVAKKGGHGEEELDWDSYGKIQEEMVLLNQLQRTTEKAKVKEMANTKAETAARIKAIKKVMLTQRRKDDRKRTKAVGNKAKSQPYEKSMEGKGALEVPQEFKLGSMSTKNQGSNVGNEGARKGDNVYSIFPAHSKLDLEHIRREKMQKEVSLADQIQAARLRKGKLQ